MRLNKSSLLLIAIIYFPLLNAGSFKLYFLGGQSNMDGYGYIKDLPAELNKTFNNTFIFHGNTSPDGVEEDGRGKWSKLKPGHGVGFRSDGKNNIYSERFGIELSFAKELLEEHPEAGIAVIKYSRGGSSIAIEAASKFGCWDPDYDNLNSVNQYDHFLAALRNAASTEDIDNDGIKDTLIPSGILWMQGESDAHDKTIAEKYEGNLKRLIDLIRAGLRYDDIPVVIGRISDSKKDEDGRVWDYGDIVRTAQHSFVNKDKFAAIVTSTDNYSYSDTWHYDSAGYIDLGEEFAKAIIKMEQFNFSK